MTFLKISVPIYKRSKWQQLEKDGRIEVSSEVDSLSDGYENLKSEIDRLLCELGAQNRLASDARSLELEIEDKAGTLKNLLRDIEKATEHCENLRAFLQNIGIDPVAPRLTFDKRFLPQAASLSEVEVVANLSEF